jgi:hypothetical protein
MSVVVIDQKDGGFLTLDITDILEVLGPRALDAVWRMSNVECVGPLADAVHHISDQGEWVPGRRLAELAKGLNQTIDGTFVASDVPGGTPWLTIRAVDSSLFEIETGDEEVLQLIRAHFGRE